MLYPELFKQLEAVRWDMAKDIPWDSFDASLLTEEQAQTIKLNAIMVLMEYLKRFRPDLGTARKCNDLHG